MIYANFIIVSIKLKCLLNAYFNQQVEDMKDDVVDSKGSRE
jgi:hypothetical protein